MKTLLARALALVFLVTANALHAQVPQLINYQGRVAVGAVNFDGSGSFKFALVNTDGSVTYWSNDGTSTIGDEPTAAVTLTVTKGLYSALLGDATLANMTAIPADVFNNADVRLRVWFNDGTNGSQLLTPDQRIAAAGYAMMAGNVPDGAITGAKIASGAVGSAQLAGSITLAGNLTLPATTATAGAILVGGSTLLHSFGTKNLFVGIGAGNLTMTGANNTASGFYALSNNTTGTGNTASGSYALFYNTTGTGNTASGNNALSNNKAGSYNIALGIDAGYHITGNYNIAIGNDGVAGESNTIRIGTSGTHTNTYIAGDIHIPANVYVDGYIFNKWGGSYLSLGDGGVGTGVFWRSSDARLKEDVATIPDALDTLGRLRGVTYRWNERGIEHLTRDIEKQWRSTSGSEEDNRKLWAEKRQEALKALDREQTGFIAQELEQVFPAWVRTDEQGYRQINVEQLTGVVVQGVNELTIRTGAQAQAIAEQAKTNTEQAKTIAAQAQAIAEGKKTHAEQQDQIRVLAETVAALKARDEAREARLTRLESLLPPATASAAANPKGN